MVNFINSSCDMDAKIILKVLVKVFCGRWFLTITQFLEC